MPSVVQMATKRLGAAAPAGSFANAGRIASSNGSASATPSPRSMVRRERCTPVLIFMSTPCVDGGNAETRIFHREDAKTRRRKKRPPYWQKRGLSPLLAFPFASSRLRGEKSAFLPRGSSFAQEDLALDRQVQEVADAGLGAGLSDQAGDHRAVAEAHVAAGAEGQDACDQVGGDAVLLFLQQGAEFLEVLERARANNLAAGIHRRAQLVADALAEAVVLDAVALVQGPHAVAPAADDIERFQGEARRIDDLVATVAALQLAVLAQLLLDGGRAAGVGLQAGDARRRWRRLEAQDALHHVDAADDRRGGGAVGADLQHRALGHQAAARAAR